MENADTRPPGSDGTVVSADGTLIHYLTVGQGPPVLVVPGVLATAVDYAAFADALGETHTAHTIERRGRGGSGPQGEAYGLARECEDIAALRHATGAALIFGHSYGGLIALEAAAASDDFRGVAVYEPGVSVGGSIALEWMSPCREMLARGKPLDAFAIFSVGAGSRRARATPVWLMKRLLPLFVSASDRERMFPLLPAALREHRVVGDLDNAYPNYQRIRAGVLAMHGGKSDLDWLAAAMRALATVIPLLTVEAFPTLDHFGPDKSGPAEVAAATSAFFAALPLP